MTTENLQDKLKNEKREFMKAYVLARASTTPVVQNPDSLAYAANNVFDLIAKLSEK